MTAYSYISETFTKFHERVPNTFGTVLSILEKKSTPTLCKSSRSFFFIIYHYFFSGAGKSIQPSGMTPTPGQISNLLCSVLDQLTLDKVILVADSGSASYIVDYLARCGEAEAADIIGCILCNPDYRQLKADGALDIDSHNLDVSYIIDVFSFPKESPATTPTNLLSKSSQIV